MKASGIYMIKSKAKPNRIYVGSAVNIFHRWQCHVSDLKKQKHHSKKLQRHYDKYGALDLQFSVLLGCNKEDLIKTEQYFLDLYKPYFNSNPKADSPLGRVITEETRLKLIKSHQGQVPVNKGIKSGYVPNNAFKKGHKSWISGGHWSDEAKAKMSKARIGKPLSESLKKKLSDIHKNLSEETKSHIKRFKTGSEPWNKGKKGVQVSTRKGTKQSPLSEEQKKKISESGKLAWIKRKQAS